MKSKIIWFSLFTILGIIACSSSFFVQRSDYATWIITTNDSTLSWAPFEWTGDSINGEYFERVGMLVPCKVEGISNVCTFQLDTGADITGVYENTFMSLYHSFPLLATKIKRLKSPLQFWNRNKGLENFVLYFGNYTATNHFSRFYKNYGEPVSNLNPQDTIHIGTMGSDIFKDNILIIDYPNKRFAICNKLPTGYAPTLTSIDLDMFGRPVLPMNMNNKSYNVLFDTGSSIFPLITIKEKIDNFSTSPDVDTVQISSWGNLHEVTGRPMNHNSYSCTIS